MSSEWILLYRVPEVLIVVRGRPYCKVSWKSCEMSRCNLTPRLAQKCSRIFSVVARLHQRRATQTWPVLYIETNQFRSHQSSQDLWTFLLGAPREITVTWIVTGTNTEEEKRDEVEEYRWSWKPLVYLTCPPFSSFPFHISSLVFVLSSPVQ